ncbi:diguanylate cyclase [Novosphingobium sp. 1949]|uniref:diguanylate cyclase n=1 Tax=Novosphingobium organovorum TaxID=2930092 RepID=A0ABT0BC37_9SPHN|nr:diguanylate cyclase [Novosphingobium organovorum]MCJ2182614.1 diguanylate cyclase [Novosphingobium organovorum]
MPDITTIALCSTSAGAILLLAMVVSWLKDGRPRRSFWLFMPFALALPAGILLSYPEAFGEAPALAIGWFLLTLAYGAAWQSARYAAQRRIVILPTLIACLAGLAISLTLRSAALHPEWRMAPRALLMAGFCLLSAREYRSIGNRHLPSAQTLAWIFAGFGLFHALRTPLSAVIPAPLGSLEPQVWSIAAFNFQIVLNGLLASVFMMTLSRERVAMHHFHLAMVDPLTGIGNRRALDRRLAEIAHERQSARFPVPENLALAILDIDRFKAINDRYGHGFGDVVIAGTANLACDAVGYRNAFRLGGEEFALLIEAESSKAIESIAERIRADFAARTHTAHDQSHRATLSIGLALFDAGTPSEDLLKEADRALYLAKALGRDRVILADESMIARLMKTALHEMVPPPHEPAQRAALSIDPGARDHAEPLIKRRSA